MPASALYTYRQMSSASKDQLLGWLPSTSAVVTVLTTITKVIKASKKGLVTMAWHISRKTLYGSHLTTRM